MVKSLSVTKAILGTFRETEFVFVWRKGSFIQFFRAKLLSKVGQRVLNVLTFERVLRVIVL